MGMSLTSLYEGETLFKDMLDKMDYLGYALYPIIPVFYVVKQEGCCK